MKTRITELFGIEHPIIQGGMHFVGFAEMAAAVANAGGPRPDHRPDPAHAGAAGQRDRALPRDDRPGRFGVNLTFLPSVTPPDYPGYIKAIIDGGVKIVETAGNNPQKSCPRSRRRGSR